MTAMGLHEALESMRTARRRIETAHESDTDGTPLLVVALSALDAAYASTEMMARFLSGHCSCGAAAERRGVPCVIHRPQAKTEGA